MDKSSTYFGSVQLLMYKDEQILLLRRANTGFEDGKWSVIAGRIDKGEEVICAAIREAKEEAGIEILESQIKVIGILQRKTENSEWIDFFLGVSGWQGEIINAEPNKCDELKWFSISKLPDDMVRYVQDGIKKVKDGIWFGNDGYK